ncbi:DUF1491 family protein [Sphingomonas canadensis]|nr:DUF1491 family protein [Sphingomonas canadensis]
MPRLTSSVLVSAMVRRANHAGGSAAVLARGDDTAGGILILACERGSGGRLFERGLGPSGDPALLPSGPADGDDSALTDYWRRRRERDPDLWVVEIDSADAEAIAAETLGLA